MRELTGEEQYVLEVVHMSWTIAQAAEYLETTPSALQKRLDRIRVQTQKYANCYKDRMPTEERMKYFDAKGRWRKEFRP